MPTLRDTPVNCGDVNWLLWPVLKTSGRPNRRTHLPAPRCRIPWPSCWKVAGRNLARGPVHHGDQLRKTTSHPKIGDHLRIRMHRSSSDFSLDTRQQDAVLLR